LKHGGEGTGRLGPSCDAVPKSLHRALKLHCVTVGTSVMAFVSKAIEEKLARSRRAQAK
jgi:hypothetical protein